MTTTYTEDANLGLATTEEMLRELICRFTVAPTDDISAFRGVPRGLILAEMLGGLDAQEREYRTVGHA
jgi:hypothetical protein